MIRDRVGCGLLLVLKGGGHSRSFISTSFMYQVIINGVNVRRLSHFIIGCERKVVARADGEIPISNMGQ